MSQIWVKMTGSKNLLQENLDLSERQFDCLVMALHGESAKSMAKKFHISPRTVETHLRFLRDKLKISRLDDARTYLLTEFGVEYIIAINQHYMTLIASKR